MDKIHIKKISKKIYQQKGFPTGPFNLCLACKCGEKGLGGACCRKGADVDKEAYNLIVAHKNYFEQKMGIKIEDCFNKRWLKDKEFLGGGGISTKTKKGTCIFRAASGEGCEIVSYVLKNNLPKRMIPSTCRIYPLLWDQGKLFLRKKIEKNCICKDKNNNTKKSIYKTQKKELDDIFFIQ